MKTLPNLKQLRKQSRLSLRKVDELTGIPYSTVNNIENGKNTNPSWQIVTTLLELYQSFPPPITVIDENSKLTQYPSQFSGEELVEIRKLIAEYKGFKVKCD